MAAVNFANARGVEVHISTQLNVSNLEAVKFYSKFADVIVLARELSLLQVAHIAKAIEDENIYGPSGKPLRLELFVHGALCMAISGKCYLSLHEYNKSANRGSCLQLCRRSYIVTDKENNRELEIDNQYIMSPKDLCTIDFLNKVLDAGVKVLKIEGRARSPEYVKTVVECYNEAIHAYLDGSFDKTKTEVWKERLSTVFNRGFWDGYYLGRTMGEWSNVYGSKATKKKIYIGKGMNYFSNLKVAEFLVESGSLKVGDEIMITGPTTGIIETTITEIRIDLQSVKEAKKGERFSMLIDQHIRRSDKLYKLVSMGNSLC
jgi:putative protease